MKDPKATYNKAISDLATAIRNMIKRDALGRDSGAEIDGWLDQVATDLQDQLNTNEEK